jgi:cephalosporin-C deacetylase
MSLRWLSLICFNVVALVAAEPRFIITQIAPDGIYATGDTITWTIKPQDLPTSPKPVITYQVQRDGAAVVAQGTLDVSSGSAIISSTLDAPGTLLATITATCATTDPGGKNTTTIKGLAGAVVDPGRIRASAPKPDDFDAFWADKLAQLALVPMNPVFEPVTTEHTDLIYGHVTMDNIKGTHIRGQLARPAKEGHYPALLVVQWAGVYPLKRAWATGPAREGWLTLNISAHDQPMDQPERFYQDLANAELKNYAAIGNDDRETSYFLRMFLACSRAVDYLAQRPD